MKSTGAGVWAGNQFIARAPYDMPVGRPLVSFGSDRPSVAEFDHMDEIANSILSSVTVNEEATARWRREMDEYLARGR